MIASEWALILIGTLLLLLGGFILLVPTIFLWIGLYALTIGIVWLVLASGGFRHVAAEGQGYNSLHACLSEALYPSAML